MSFDISHLLQEWDFSPGHVISRRFRGRDGKEKIQLRVDLGILQMNTEGRPDGKRPLGYESWYECYKARWEKAKIAQGEDSHGFTLGQEECGKLQQESIQYHHRYICLFQLEDFEGVLRDCDRNLEVFGFVDEFAAGEELGWSLNQFAPQLLMMRTRAAGTKSLKSNRFRETEKTIREGIDALEDFYRNHAREELIDSSGELNSLRNWLNDVRAKKPGASHAGG